MKVFDAVADEELVVGSTTSSAEPTRLLRPSKVTRAFSETHERFPALKRSRSTEGKSGMEKLDCAVEIRRGMESPRVTFEYWVLRFAVVQPVVPPIEQVAPVKPLMHIQAHAPLLKNVLPPFWHAVEELVAHACRGVTVDAAVVDLALWKTRSSSGTTTAAAMTISIISRTSKKPQTGRPQQRRLRGGGGFSRPPVSS